MTTAVMGDTVQGMNALETRKAVQKLLGVAQDGDFGSLTQAAYNRLKTAPEGSEWPKSTKALTGDGTWPWTAEIDDEDIVVVNARATCFGGSSDPQDSGDTASGVSTKKNPNIEAVSLPMDGRQFPSMSKAEHAALDGSPIPKVPWRTAVRVEAMGQSYDFPVIDLGPGKRTNNQIDLTVAAARRFKPNASATNFEMRCTFRILGGARFVV